MANEMEFVIRARYEAAAMSQASADAQRLTQGVAGANAAYLQLGRTSAGTMQVFSDSTRTIRAVAGSFLNELNPATGAAISTMAMAASAARNMSAGFGLLTVAAAAVVPPVMRYVEALQRAQDQQVSLMGSVRSRDLGGVVAQIKALNDQFDRLAVQQRIVNDPNASALDRAKAAFQVSTGPSFSELMDLRRNAIDAFAKVQPVEAARQMAQATQQLAQGRMAMLVIEREMAMQAGNLMVSEEKRVGILGQLVDKHKAERAELEKTYELENAQYASLLGGRPPDNVLANRARQRAAMRARQTAEYEQQDYGGVRSQNLVEIEQLETIRRAVLAGRTDLGDYGSVSGMGGYEGAIGKLSAEILERRRRLNPYAALLEEQIRDNEAQARYDAIYEVRSQVTAQGFAGQMIGADAATRARLTLEQIGAARDVQRNLAFAPGIDPGLAAARVDLAERTAATQMRGVQYEEAVRTDPMAAFRHSLISIGDDLTAMGARVQGAMQTYATASASAWSDAFVDLTTNRGKGLGDIGQQLAKSLYKGFADELGRLITGYTLAPIRQALGGGPGGPFDLGAAGAPASGAALLPQTFTGISPIPTSGGPVARFLSSTIIGRQSTAPQDAELQAAINSGALTGSEAYALMNARAATSPGYTFTGRQAVGAGLSAAQLALITYSATQQPTTTESIVTSGVGGAVAGASLGYQIGGAAYGTEGAVIGAAVGAAIAAGAAAFLGKEPKKESAAVRSARRAQEQANALTDALSKVALLEEAVAALNAQVSRNVILTAGPNLSATQGPEIFPSAAAEGNRGHRFFREQDLLSRDLLDTLEAQTGAAGQATRNEDLTEMIRSQIEEILRREAAVRFQYDERQILGGAAVTRTTQLPFTRRHQAVGQQLEVLADQLLQLPADVKAKFLAQLAQADYDHDLGIIRLDDLTVISLSRFTMTANPVTPVDPNRPQNSDGVVNPGDNPAFSGGGGEGGASGVGGAGEPGGGGIGEVGGLPAGVGTPGPFGAGISVPFFGNFFGNLPASLQANTPEANLISALTGLAPNSNLVGLISTLTGLGLNFALPNLGLAKSVVNFVGQNMQNVRTAEALNQMVMQESAVGQFAISPPNPAQVEANLAIAASLAGRGFSFTTAEGARLAAAAGLNVYSGAQTPSGFVSLDATQHSINFGFGGFGGSPGTTNFAAGAGNTTGGEVGEGGGGPSGTSTGEAAGGETGGGSEAP